MSTITMTKLSALRPGDMFWPNGDPDGGVVHDVTLRYCEPNFTTYPRVLVTFAGGGFFKAGDRYITSDELYAPIAP